MSRKRRPAGDYNADELMAALSPESVAWVSAMLHEETRVSRDQAPNVMAWNLYEHVKSDERAKSRFWDAVIKASQAKKEDITREKAMADDGRKFLKLFDDLEREKPELLNDDFPRRPPAAESINAGNAEVASAGTAKESRVPDSASAAEISA